MSTCAEGAVFLGPPGLGGDRRGLSKPLGNQSFFTGGGKGADTVAIDTSPKMSTSNYRSRGSPSFHLQFHNFYTNNP